MARDQGDRLLACGKGRGAVTDVTETRGLRSTSLVHAWGNFTGQGRLDLVSFDGKGATLHAQQADGTFTVRPLELGTALDGGTPERLADLVKSDLKLYGDIVKAANIPQE